MPHPIDDLFGHVRQLYHRMVSAAEALHAAEPVTIGSRAVLEYLQRHGPSTVPEIARQRGVSRQHVQVLVNTLTQHDLVALRPNPAHKRSPQIHLNTAGKRTITRMRRREARFYEKTDFGLSAEEISSISAGLATISDALRVEVEDR